MVCVHTWEREGVIVAQSCPTLCTGLVALWHVGSSQTRNRTCVPCIGRQILNHSTPGKPYSALLKYYSRVYQLRWWFTTWGTRPWVLSDDSNLWAVFNTVNDLTSITFSLSSSFPGSLAVTSLLSQNPNTQWGNANRLRLGRAWIGCYRGLGFKFF